MSHDVELFKSFQLCGYEISRAQNNSIMVILIAEMWQYSNYALLINNSYIHVDEIDIGMSKQYRARTVAFKICLFIKIYVTYVYTYVCYGFGKKISIKILSLDFVPQYFTAKCAWIGLTDESTEGTWRWLNSQNLNFTGKLGSFSIAQLAIVC